MKRLLRPRIWIALLLGAAAALLAYHWPTSPRMVLHVDHTCWHVAFSPDSTMVSALDREAGLHEVCQVRVWDAATGELRHRIELGKKHYPNSLMFAPDGKTLGMTDAGAVTKWDLDTGRVLAHHDHAAWSHKADHWLEILFSPEGQWLYHSVEEGRVYEVETGRIVRDYAERWPNRQLSGHRSIVVARVEEEVKTFDVLTGKEIRRFAPRLTVQPFSRNGLSFSNDGTHGVFWVPSGELVVHNAVSGTQRSLPPDWDGWYSQGCWSADNRYYALKPVRKPARGLIDDLLKRVLGARDGICVLDTTTGREVSAPFHHCNQCWFAPDGKTLAVADGDHHLLLWDWPPSSRWPMALIMGSVAMVLSFGISVWCGRRRIVAGKPPTEALAVPSASETAKEPRTK